MDRIVRLTATSRKSVVKDVAGSGHAAEEIAAIYLARHGLKVVSRNYRVRGGEIDLICEDKKALVFVEVRLRSTNNFGGAAASITQGKQRRLILAARHWLSQNGGEYSNRDCRFDCVLMDAPDESRIEWIKDAFTSE